MNTSNRFEETWKPNWDLGLQVEFDFGTNDRAEDESVPALARSDRPNAWAMASKEVLNRRGSSTRRVAYETSTLAEVLSYFESLAVEGEDDE